MSVRDGMVLMESRPVSASKGLSQFRRYLSVSYPSIPNAAAILAGGMVLIKVGAATEVKMKEKKARVEDAPAERNRRKPRFPPVTHLPAELQNTRLRPGVLFLAIGKPDLVTTPGIIAGVVLW
jgi:hypothetical protein